MKGSHIRKNPGFMWSSVFFVCDSSELETSETKMWNHGGLVGKKHKHLLHKYGGTVLFDSETFWTRFLWRFDFVINHFRDTDCYCTALYLGATLNWFTDCYGYGPQTCWVFSSSFQVILRSLEGQQNVTCCYFFRIMARWKNEDFQTYELLKEG